MQGNSSFTYDRLYLEGNGKPQGMQGRNRSYPSDFRLEGNGKPQGMQGSSIASDASAILEGGHKLQSMQGKKYYNQQLMAWRVAINFRVCKGKQYRLRGFEPGG